MKAYWVANYTEIKDDERLKKYAVKAKEAVEKYNGKVLASTNKIKVFEDGKVEQTVLVEFESFEKAAEFIDSKEYQDALAALDGGANRDCRVFEGL